MAGLFNVAQALYLAGMGALPSPGFFGLAEAWSAVFALVPAITIGSIAAEVISEWVDTEIYHVLRHKGPQWLAVLGSNAVSLPLDSFLFGVLGFWILPKFLGGHAEPFMGAMAIVAGQILWKAIVTIVSLPTIYLVKDKPII